jgi:hypothetical protein
MTLAQPDRDKLKSLWEAYNGASGDAKKARESELLAALKQIGQDALAPTRQQYADRAEKVKAVFTQQQLAQLSR